MGELFGKVGVFTDVHGDVEAIEMVLGFLDSRGIGTVLCGGDIVDGDGGVEECCRVLRDRGIPTVRGNHDRWYCDGTMRELPESTSLGSLSEQSAEWLRDLPRTLSFECPLGRVLLCHGLRENDMATFRPGDYGYGVEVNEDLQASV